jgi:hypothetical protein
LEALVDYLGDKSSKLPEISLNAETKIIDNYYKGQLKACFDLADMIVGYVSTKCPKRKITKDDFIVLINNTQVLIIQSIEDSMCHNSGGSYDCFLKGKEDLYREIKEILEDYLYVGD